MACCLVFCEHYVINKRLCSYKIFVRLRSCDWVTHFVCLMCG